MTCRSWTDLVAQFSPEQIAAAEASVTAAAEFTDEQLHRLRPLFSGSGERVVGGRVVTQERGAA